MSAETLSDQLLQQQVFRELATHPDQISDDAVRRALLTLVADTDADQLLEEALTDGRIVLSESAALPQVHHSVSGSSDIHPATTL